MSLETEVAALTQATTDLLDAVNIRKTQLDAAVAVAQDAASAAESVFDVANVQAAANVTLLQTSATYQMITPIDGSRTVTLPSMGANDRKAFSISHAGSVNLISVVNAAAQSVYSGLTAGQTVAVIWTGTTWRVL